MRPTPKTPGIHTHTQYTEMVVGEGWKKNCPAEERSPQKRKKEYIYKNQEGNKDYYIYRAAGLQGGCEGEWEVASRGQVTPTVGIFFKVTQDSSLLFQLCSSSSHVLGVSLTSSSISSSSSSSSVVSFFFFSFYSFWQSSMQ